MEYNTPSGSLNTALDKFVFHYVTLGYSWYTVKNENGYDDDFLFIRTGSVLRATADYGEKDGRTVCGGLLVQKRDTGGVWSKANAKTRHGHAGWRWTF